MVVTITQMRRFLLALAFLCLTGLTAACSSGERPYLTDPADTTTSTVPEDGHSLSTGKVAALSIIEQGCI